MARIFYFLLLLSLILWGYPTLAFLGAIFLILYQYQYYYELLFLGVIADSLSWGILTVDILPVPIFSMIACVILILFSFLRKYIVVYDA